MNRQSFGGVLSGRLGVLFRRLSGRLAVTSESEPRRLSGRLGVPPYNQQPTTTSTSKLVGYCVRVTRASRPASQDLSTMVANRARYALLSGVTA